MDTDVLHTARRLPKHGLERIAARPGRRVECLHGSLWLTIDGDRRDIVLEPGQGFTLERRDAGVIVSALDSSAFLVLDEATA